jgi:hypothetical protein
MFFCTSQQENETEFMLNSKNNISFVLYKNKTIPTYKLVMMYLYLTCTVVYKAFIIKNFEACT